MKSKTKDEDKVDAQNQSVILEFRSLIKKRSVLRKHECGQWKNNKKIQRSVNERMHILNSASL